MAVHTKAGKIKPDRLNIDCIVLDGDHSEFWINPGEYCGAYCIPSTDGPCTNVNIQGSIALNFDMQVIGLTKDLTNITFSDFASWHTKKGMWARDAAIFNHTTFGDITQAISADSPGNFGLYFYPGDDPVNSISIKNSIIQNVAGVALTGFSFEDYNVLYGNGSNYQDVWYQTMIAGTHTVTNANPGLKYLTRIEADNAILHLTADDGKDRGATILKKIGRDGTMWGETGYNEVTGDSLWPFPNESIIKQYLASYSYTGITSSGSDATLSGNRGFAASGNGLYGGPITLTSYIWEYLGNACPQDICK